MERTAGTCCRFVCHTQKDKTFQITQNRRGLCRHYAYDISHCLWSGIWICWTPLLTVTKVGITLLSIGFMLPALSYGRLLRLYYGLKIDSTNIDYIDNLLRIKKREYRQQHLILNLYFFFLSIGFALYGYEYTFFHSFYWGIIAYSILLLWIALNWFVFRPRIIRKRNHKFYSVAVDCSKLVCVPTAYNKKTQSQVLRLYEVHRKS